MENPYSSALSVVRNDFLAVEKIGWEIRRRAERQFRQPTAG